MGEQETRPPPEKPWRPASLPPAPLHPSQKGTRMNRTLRLHAETLVELTSDELGSIAGGITQNCNTLHFCVIPTLPLFVCIPPPE